MCESVQMREAMERIRERHKPGKLVGLYRGLRRAHAASEPGGWTSVALLTAGVINQMIRSGSQLWWDMVDLDFSSLASPDSMRDEIGIRTLAASIEYGVSSESFITLTAVTSETGIKQYPVVAIPCKEVNSIVSAAAQTAGVPTGGFYPMFEHMGDAIREANLCALRVFSEDYGARIRLFDEKEMEEGNGRVTSYDIRINFNNLLKDIDTIKASLARNR